MHITATGYIRSDISHTLPFPLFSPIMVVLPTLLFSHYVLYVLYVCYFVCVCVFLLKIKYHAKKFEKLKPQLLRPKGLRPVPANATGWTLYGRG